MLNFLIISAEVAQMRLEAQAVNQNAVQQCSHVAQLISLLETHISHNKERPLPTDRRDLPLEKSMMLLTMYHGELITCIDISALPFKVRFYVK